MKCRTDHEGRQHKADCGCKGRKHDRGTLAKPLTLSLDSPDFLRLRKLAEDIYVRNTIDTITIEQRRDMESVVAWLDGRPLPSDYNKHPLFIAGVLLGSARRAGIKVASDGVAPKPIVVSARERERAAREALQNESRVAWKKTK